MGIKSCDGAVLLDFPNVTRLNISHSDKKEIVMLKIIYFWNLSSQYASHAAVITWLGH